MNDIYYTQVLDTCITIKPRDLNYDINTILHNNLKSKVEGCCIKEGYIKPNSTKIISRSNGQMNIANFNGNITYTIKYTADVCNPKIDNIIECIVSDNNKSAVNAYYDNEDTSPLNIFLPKQHHIGNTEFIKLNKNDLIKIKVTGTKYEYLDQEILVLGQFIEKNL